MSLERDDWKEIREDVMLECLRAKFTQSPECRKALLDTGEAILHYFNSKDEKEKKEKDVKDEEGLYWGTGKEHLGGDRLGALLMIVREELRRN